MPSPVHLWNLLRFLFVSRFYSFLRFFFEFDKQKEFLKHPEGEKTDKDFQHFSYWEWKSAIMQRKVLGVEKRKQKVNKYVACSVSHHLSTVYRIHLPAFGPQSDDSAWKLLILVLFWVCVQRGGAHTNKKVVGRDKQMKRGIQAGPSKDLGFLRDAFCPNSSIVPVRRRQQTHPSQTQRRSSEQSVWVSDSSLWSFTVRQVPARNYTCGSWVTICSNLCTYKSRPWRFMPMTSQLKLFFI